MSENVLNITPENIVSVTIIILIVGAAFKFLARAAQG